MTRYKRKKLALLVKCAVIAVLPLSAAVGIRLLPKIDALLQKADSIVLEKAQRQGDSTKGELVSQPSYGIGLNEDFEDIINEEYFLSEGFGFEEEQAAEPAVNSLSPLDMVSENPGEKPYPENWSEGLPIERTTYGKFSGSSYFDLEKCGQVNNRTSVSNERLIKESRYLPDFSLEETAEPQVLIYHTHTTESFEPYVRDFLDPSFNYRTTDDTKNIVMVGNEITRQLEAQGIGVIHATDIHDYPSYNGSYARSRETIKPILEKYPTIKVVLDIHRDAISNSKAAYQPVVEINGKEAAQIMIISGCDDGTLNMPNYMKNFRFASYLQQHFEGDYPGLTRPILFDYRKYNQDLTTGSLLIEVGAHSSTLEQVQYSGQLIGASLGRALSALQ